MPEAKVTEADYPLFISLFETSGVPAVAHQFKLDHRRVFTWRRKIESQIGRPLVSSVSILCIIYPKSFIVNL